MNKTVICSFILTSLFLISVFSNKTNFTFSYWYRFDTFRTFDGKTCRKYLYDQMVEIVQLFEFFPDNNDISVGFASIIVKMNLDSINYFLMQLEAQFKGACSECKFPPFKGKEEGTDIDALLDRVEKLQANISYLMLARMPRMNFFRVIAQMFLLNDEPWMDNIIDFTLIPKINFDEQSAALFVGAAPSYADFVKVINNKDFSFPNVNETSYCLNALGYHVMFHPKFPQMCMIPADCLKFVAGGTSFGWALSHRLLIMIFAKFGRSCYFTSVEEDKIIVEGICEYARMGLDMLEFGDYEFPGLMLELVTFCSLFGHRNIFNIEWLVKLKHYYYPSGVKVYGKPVGCLKTLKKANAPNLEPLLKGRTWWQLVRYDNDQLDTCNRHSTAMYIAALASAFRATFQPAYCPYKNKNQPPEYCFLPRKINWDKLNFTITQKENRRNFYEILGEKKLCFPFSNDSCGPFRINKTHYEGLSFNETRVWPPA